MKTPVFRGKLIEQILSRPEPVIVLDAPAGMGKSTLLGQIAERLDVTLHIAHTPPAEGDGIVLWDIPPYGTPAALPECYVTGRRRIVIAKRPDSELIGLARATAYQRVYSLDPEALLISENEARALFGADRAMEILRLTGGWPLIAFREGLIAGMEEFLMQEFLENVPNDELVDLKLLIAGAALPARQRNNLFPVASAGSDGTLHFRAEALAGVLDSALDAMIRLRLETPGNVKSIAEAYAHRGKVVEAISVFQRAGFHDDAFEQFNKAGGLFFLYFHGPAAFDQVLSGFPHSYAHQSEILVLSLGLQAVKRGDVSRARRLLLDRFGEQINDLEAVYDSRSAFSREFREFSFVLMIFEDHQFNEEMLARLFKLNAEFPGDEHLFRGSLYNSVLEFYIRRRQFTEAEDVAQRAMYHYEAAGSPMLCFYISLHQAMIGLLQGDNATARKHALRSAKSLAEVPFETPNDMRLQKLVDACIEYESGRAEPLARFLNSEIDEFTHGEIWPSLMEVTLHYGSQAMITHFSLVAARGFLDRWRVYQASNQAFQEMVNIREAVVLQHANRWTEASTRLKVVGLEIDRDRILADPDGLASLTDRDDIGLTLAWLRQILHEQPDLPQLERAIVALTGNLRVTDRQRLSLSIWQALIFKRRQDLTGARAVLLRLFEHSARLDSIAPLAEENVFLDELMGNKRISEFLAASSPARQVIRKLRDSGHMAPVSGIGSELSRRENKILVMISEGAANKSIAGMLGVSEATVKFHLGNVYRKLGCKTRQEAIGAARAAGIVN
ncbi:LuxR family transcriptional regulator [Rhizobium sp. KVB221]|uniref:LuxR family transcriptional regulator n=1 Tax=Rhizobium setariae TaxID=2801340 RepID=A0A937CL65_9HYPH|nr:LuxR C-terminal-related transcriptional regulator [Rhizobium setariae]MBL0372860.1 LuxR family transcriptional regulator [Rhizobium setariae]